MSTISMPWQPALRQRAAEHAWTAASKSTATCDEHGAGFGSHLCREWRDDTGQTYHIRCRTTGARRVLVGTPHRPDATQRWTCTFRTEDGCPKTFLLTPDEPSGKMWWGFGKSLYCVIGEVAHSGLLRWYRPGARIASSAWRANPVEEKRTGCDRPVPISSSVGPRSLARSGRTVKLEGRPQRRPKEVSTRPCDEPCDEPCERLAGKAAESSGDGEKRAAEDEALEAAAADAPLARRWLERRRRAEAAAVAAPPGPADTDCSREHGPVDEPRSRAELSEKAAAKGEALEAGDAFFSSAGTACSEERGPVDAPCSRVELTAALRHLLEHRASAIIELPEGFRPQPGLAAPPGMPPLPRAGSDSSCTDKAAEPPGPAGWQEPAQAAPAGGTREHLEEERIQAAQEPRSPPAVDARQQGCPSSCCGSDGSSTEEGSPLPVEPGARGGVIRTSGAILELPEGFWPPPGLAAPPGMPPWVRRGPGAAPVDETRAGSDASCTDEAAEPPGPAGWQEPAQAAPAGGTREHLEEERIQAAQEPRNPPAVDARQQGYPSLCCGSGGSRTEEGSPLPVEPGARGGVIRTSGAILELPEGFWPPPGLAAPPGMPPWVRRGPGAAPVDETLAGSDSSCTDEAAEPPGPAGWQEPAQAAPAGGKAGEPQGKVQELTDDALGALLRLWSQSEANGQRGLAATLIAQPFQLQVEDVVIGRKAPHDPEQAAAAEAAPGPVAAARGRAALAPARADQALGAGRLPAAPARTQGPSAAAPPRRLAARGGPAVESQASGKCPALERLVAQQLQGQTNSTTSYQINFVLHAGFVAVAFVVGAAGQAVVSSSLAPGRKVLARYDEDLWHVRVLLSRIEDTRWIIYTPDRDLYEEDYGSNNGDITGVRASRSDGSIPASLQGANIYNFRVGAEPDQAALRGLMEEAQDLVALAVPGAAGAIVEKRGIARAGPDLLLVEKVARIKVEQWKTDHAASSDARVLPVRYAPSGERLRSWANVTESANESAIDHWPVKGPRTAQWVARFMARRSTGPEDHHLWWRSTARLNASEWGVAEHGQLCSYLEAAGSVDQLDLSNLVVMEKIARRLQTMEYQCAEKVREGERGGSAGASSSVAGSAVITNDEMDLFEGRQHVNPTVCCAPAPIEHASKELEKESQIQKQAFSGISGGRDYSGENSPAVPLDESLLSLRTFTVRKKSGAQRLNADCRQSNCFFTSSDHVELPASGALSRLRLEASSAVAGAAREERVLSRSGDAGRCLTRQAPAPPALQPGAARPAPPAGGSALVAPAAAPAEEPRLPRRRSATATAPEHARRRVRRRQEAHGAVRALPGRTVLETIVARAPTRRSYLRRLAMLARRSGMAIARNVAGAELDRAQDRIISFLGQMNAASLDAAVAEHLNEEFFEGATGGEGSRLLAALSWVFASVGKQVCNLPRARTCSVALRRLAPGESRLPVPESLLFVVANELIAEGRLQQGVAVSAAHHCYLRPGELSRITWRMIHPPVSASGPGATVTIVPRPFELGASSKVGEFDETVKVDWLPLAAALLRLRRIRPADERLAGIGSVAIGESAAQVIREFGLEEAIGEFMMHRLRHSGPCADFLAGRRTITEIKHRGTSGPTRALIVPFFLEIFAGTARVSKEMARLGFLAIAIDTRFGMRHDMRKRSLVRAMRGWIMSGFVIGEEFAATVREIGRAQDDDVAKQTCRPPRPLEDAAGGAVLSSIAVEGTPIRSPRPRSPGAAGAHGEPCRAAPVPLGASFARSLPALPLAPAPPVLPEALALPVLPGGAAAPVSPAPPARPRPPGSGGGAASPRARAFRPAVAPAHLPFARFQMPAPPPSAPPSA
ncbi:unnamed protein product [Prorocentrum cordatum]|uniref:Uncharacterized protein n=1 Tax=Prorocentrum cordatum TaxID=2364126 RepID=A0ABN9Q9Y7_9DINO|nr:unnamed protein product [Polarella glacialis]